LTRPPSVTRLPREVNVTAGTPAVTIAIDPNRIFTATGRAAQVASGVSTLRGAGTTVTTAQQTALGGEGDALATDLTNKIGRGRGGSGSNLMGPLPIVAMHNNEPGDARTPYRPRASPPTGPGLSIRSYLPTDPRQPSGFHPSERRATDAGTPAAP